MPKIKYCLERCRSPLDEQGLMWGALALRGDLLESKGVFQTKYTLTQILTWTSQCSQQLQEQQAGLPLAVLECMYRNISL